MTVAFAPIADSLRSAVIDWYAERDQAETGVLEAGSLELQSGSVALRAEPLVEMLRANGMPPLDQVRAADLGCGFGAISVYLAAGGAEVVGVDQKPQRLEIGRAVAEQHGLAASFHAAKMEALEELEDQSFDLAVQNNSLCYLVSREDRRAALREALRILRPGGRLLTRNPNRWHPVDQFTKVPLIQLLPPGLAVAAAGATGRRRSFVRLASPPAMRRELKAAGFVDIVHCGVREDRWPDALKLVARYQHFVARRPE